MHFGEPHGTEQFGGVYTPPVATTPADTLPPITQPSGPPPPAGPPDIGFTDPTTGFTSTSGVAPVGSPQWYAQMGSNASNIEEMVETATGLNVTEQWLEQGKDLDKQKKATNLN